MLKKILLITALNLCCCAAAPIVPAPPVSEMCILNLAISDVHQFPTCDCSMANTDMVSEPIQKQLLYCDRATAFPLNSWSVQKAYNDSIRAKLGQCKEF